MEKKDTSQIGVMPGSALPGNTANIGRLRGCTADYNANNSWYFNGDNGCFNNNNRYNGNFRCRPALDYIQYDYRRLESYPVPLSEWLLVSKRTAKGKHNKPSYVYFIIHRAEELIRLTYEVGEWEIMPTVGTAHVIKEPRLREIVCAMAVKKTMQSWYVESLRPYLEYDFFHKDSYSCRRGKGGLKAVLQLQDYIYEGSNGYTEDCWIGQVDIQAFFMSLDCFLLTDIITRFIDEKMADNPKRDLLKYMTRVVYLAATKDHLKDMAHPHERAMLDPKKSIYNNPYYKGVPIGDWTSQTAGLIIINFLLEYLSSLGVAFVHYTDDNTMVLKGRWQWREIIPRIEKFCKDELKLTLHPKKRYIQHYSKGVKLLGYKVRFNRILPSDRIYHNIMWYLERTIRKAEERSDFAVIKREKIMATVNSYLGFLRWCDGYKLRKEICRRIESSPLGRVLQVADDYTKVNIRREYSKKAYYLKAYRETKSNLKNFKLCKSLEKSFAES